jgi:hypothetical protein
MIAYDAQYDDDHQDQNPDEIIEVD